MNPFRSSRALAAAAALVVLAAGCGAAPEGEAPKTAHAAEAGGADAGTVTVYKTPTCGCCAKWVEHLTASGYKVVVHDMENVDPVKREHGVPGHLQSCHTALVGGYVVEGHVPADVIRKLVSERPKVAGIAVPGMPMGSPGMEGPYTERYDVIAFEENGKTRVYARR